MRSFFRHFQQPPAALVDLVPRMRRYGRMLLRDVHAADELVRDALEQLAMHGESAARSTCTSVFAIMHKLAYERRLPSCVTARPISNAGVPGDGLSHLLACIEALAAEEREVLVLVAVERLVYRTIATILDVPIGTVMSRLTRARESLRVAQADAGTHQRSN